MHILVGCTTLFEIKVYEVSMRSYIIYLYLCLLLPHRHHAKYGRANTIYMEKLPVQTNILLSCHIYKG